MHEPITLLYEDNHCLAVAKPAPLSTQSPPHATADPSLETLVKNYLRVRDHKPTAVYLGTPHRLDRPVTGVVLFARSTTAAQRLAAQFAQRQVRKVYWAVVEDFAGPDDGTWEDWLRKAPGVPRAEVVEASAAGAKRALLRYRRLCTLTTGTLLEIEPETGRTHQIRVQAAQRGCPVLGDVAYGARGRFGPAGGGVIALHARSLTVLHPIRYEPVTVTAPLPETWNDV